MEAKESLIKITKVLNIINEGRTVAPRDIKRGYLESLDITGHRDIIDINRNVYLIALHQMIGERLQPLVGLPSKESRGLPSKKPGEAEQTRAGTKPGQQTQGTPRADARYIQSTFLASTPQFMFPQFGRIPQARAVPGQEPPASQGTQKPESGPKLQQGYSSQALLDETRKLQKKEEPPPRTYEPTSKASNGPGALRSFQSTALRSRQTMQKDEEPSFHLSHEKPALEEKVTRKQRVITALRENPLRLQTPKHELTVPPRTPTILPQPKTRPQDGNPPLESKPTETPPQPKSPTLPKTQPGISESRQPEAPPTPPRRLGALFKQPVVEGQESQKPPAPPKLSQPAREPQSRETPTAFKPPETLAKETPRSSPESIPSRTDLKNLLSQLKKPEAQPPMPQPAPAGQETDPARMQGTLQRLREELHVGVEGPTLKMIPEKAQAEPGAKTEILQWQAKATKADDSPRTRTDQAEERGEVPLEKEEQAIRAPLREKSFIRCSGFQKIYEDGRLRKDADSPIRPISEFGERASHLAGMAAASYAAPQEGRAQQKVSPHFDFKPLEFSQSRQYVEEIGERQGRHEQQEGQSSPDQGGGGRPRFSFEVGRQLAQGAQGEQQIASRPRPEEISREALKKMLRRDQLIIEQTSKQAPLRHTREAVRHASTSIESILKKSQKETWTGEEMAAKLIALLMKASSNYTFEHSTRVIDLSTELAREVGVTDKKFLKEIEEGAMFHDIGEVEMDLRGMSDREKERLARYLGEADLENCSFLHDIGKIKIPEKILMKSTRLTDEEFEILRQHPIIGEQILKPIPPLRHALPVVRHHHERWDGNGYPDGLEGHEIPLSARIISITDSFDAMISDRPYREGMSVEAALAEIETNAGTQFDPQIAQSFVRLARRRYGLPVA